MAEQITTEDKRKLLESVLLKWAKTRSQSGAWGGSSMQQMGERILADPSALTNEANKFLANPAAFEKLAAFMPDAAREYTNAVSKTEKDLAEGVVPWVRQGGANDPANQSGEQIMRDFAARMMGQLDLNDPYVKQVIQASAGAADKFGAARGVRGGLASSNVANAAANAGNAVQMQRNQLGLSALGNAEGIRQQDAIMAEQVYNRQYQAQLEQMQQQHAAGKAQTQALWSAVGGLAGSVPGMISNNPSMMQTGMQFGSQMGGGLSGANYQRPPTLGYNSPNSKPKSGGPDYGGGF